jgi:hypothetical protein
MSSLQPTLPPSEKVSATSPWELARNVIEHEDNLINHRLTWLITIQGFLFAAFAVVAKDLFDSTHGRETMLRVTLYATAFLGIASAYIVWNTIRTAFIYMRCITEWWNQNFDSRQVIQGQPYPPLRGTRGNMSTLRKWLHTHNLPLLFIAIWAVLLVSGLIW